MDVRDRRRRRAKDLDLGRLSFPPERDGHGRHPLRHPLVEARYDLGRCLCRHAARRVWARRPLRARLLRRGLYDQSANRGRDRREGMGRLRLRRRAARSRTRWPRAADRPAPLFLEERQVGPRLGAPGRGRARLLGDVRVPPLRRSVARAALRGRLTWQVAMVDAVVEETARVRTIVLDVPDWPGHRAGQHLDVRLTAEDGYRAEREYSIASAPGEPVAITVERLDDGEVSPYLTEELRPGDAIELRGPVAGGSGIVPLRAMLRHRRRSGSDVAACLLYSSHSLADVIYRTELDELADGVTVLHTLTREQPAGWTGYARRVDAALLGEVAWPSDRDPLTFVCGPTSFVETVASGLVELGYRPGRVKTERFGATGGR